MYWCGDLVCKGRTRSGALPSLGTGACLPAKYRYRCRVTVQWCGFVKISVWGLIYWWVHMLFPTLWGAIVPVIIVCIQAGAHCILVCSTGAWCAWWYQNSILVWNHRYNFIEKPHFAHGEEISPKENIKIELSAGDVLHDVTKRTKTGTPALFLWQKSDGFWLFPRSLADS